MDDSTGPFSRHKIVVLNPKGGSGKTTIATNLASTFAVRGAMPTLIDCDPNGFSMRWVEKRPATRPPVHGIAAFELTRAQAVGVSPHPDSKEVIYDLPAGASAEDAFDYIYDASSILLPIVPSEIDVYAAARFIAELLLITQVDRRRRKLAIVANRTRQNTRSYRMLMRFLNSLDIPVVAHLRDSQSFVQASAFGMGICEMPPSRVRPDLDELDKIVRWLDRWRSRQLDAFLAEELARTPDLPTLTEVAARSH